MLVYNSRVAMYMDYTVQSSANNIQLTEPNTFKHSDQYTNELFIFNPLKTNKKWKYFSIQLSRDFRNSTVFWKVPGLIRLSFW